MKRKDFLQKVSLTTLLSGLALPTWAGSGKNASSVSAELQGNVTDASLSKGSLSKGSLSNESMAKGSFSDKVFSTGSMVDFKVAPIPKVRVGIIGLGNRGQGLLEMFTWLVKRGKAEIIALSDLKADKLQKSQEQLATFQSTPAQLYVGDEHSWKKLVERDDLDLVVVCTPWDLHVPMSIYAMEQGHHVACEVPIATTLEDCHNLIQVAERTRRHCMMMENCNYNGEELWILNMIQEGVFGELTHAEGAYIHDLRWLLLDERYYENQWRLKQQMNHDGSLYTTHGLGPIAAYFDIGRGDNFASLVSMSSKQASLKATALKQGRELPIKGGDMNTTLIRTSLGRTIMLQHDVYTGRPYSRLNTVCGTKAVHQGYPSRLYVDPEVLTAWGHQWLKPEEYKTYRERYDHPIWARLKEQIKENEAGHGGMDFVMIYRLIDCLNRGDFLDINVYDSVAWSAITPLSELSVAQGSTAIQIPDFYGGTSMRKVASPFMRV